MTIALFAKATMKQELYRSPYVRGGHSSDRAMIPGVDLTPKLAIVPAEREPAVQRTSLGGLSWNYIALIFLSTSVYAAGALYLAVKMFNGIVLFRS